MSKLKNTTTQFVSIQASYDRAFDYLINPLPYKDWSVNFIKDVRVEKSDKATDNIDIFMGEGKRINKYKMFWPVLKYQISHTAINGASKFSYFFIILFRNEKGHTQNEQETG